MLAEKTPTSSQYYPEVQKFCIMDLGFNIIPVPGQNEAASLLAQMVLSPSLLVVFQFWKLLFEIILILEKVKYHNLHISTVKKWIDLLFTGCKWKSHECQPLFKEENLSCWWSIVNHHKVYSRAWGCESSKFAGTLWKYENHIQYT